MKSKRNNNKAKHVTFCAGVALTLGISLSACQTPRPQQVQNICGVFKQYPKWYWASRDAQEKWGVPIAVQMSIVHQESGFNGKIKPDRTKLLGIIPWKRPSSAYGYSQALKGTWDHYQTDTGQSRAKRSAFADAVDFIGWYGHQANLRAGIHKRNAKHVYLAYHEGIGGYQRKTYHGKPSVVKVADKVSSRADIYQQQLNQCQASLPEKPWWRKIL